MMGRHHVAVAGALSAVAAAWLYRNGWAGVAGLPTAGAFVAVGGGAGLAPDVDEPGSSAPRTFGWLGMGVCHLIRLVVRKHRGATHTVEVLAGSCAVLLWLAVPHPGTALQLTSLGRAVASGHPAVADVLAWPALGHPLIVAVAAGLAVAVGVDTLRGVSSMQALAVGAVVGCWVSVTVGPGEWWPVAAIAVGWFAHLLSDTPTPHGVPWTVLTLVFGWRYPSLRWFRTGSPVEGWVTAAAVVGLGFAAWKVSGVTSLQQVANG